jgi:hypothetical protein
MIMFRITFREKANEDFHGQYMGSMCGLPRVSIQGHGSFTAAIKSANAYSNTFFRLWALLHIFCQSSTNPLSSCRPVLKRRKSPLNHFSIKRRLPEYHHAMLAIVKPMSAGGELVTRIIFVNETECFPPLVVAYVALWVPFAA